MTLSEIGLFLLPTDIFQWCFLVLIGGIAFWNIFEVTRKANPEFWLSSWKNHTPEIEFDDLDAEHGSIVELSQVISHKAERWAEIMPGILLIIGLLGTFVGIGIALNKAAALLHNAQGDDGALRAISDMLPMLEGLGTKFKTSTWGIIGFLCFKTWHSRYGTEEKRLRWCITHTRDEIVRRRQNARKSEEAKQKLLIDTLTSVGDTMCRTMKNEMTSNRDVLNKKLEEAQKSSIANSSLLEKLIIQGEKELKCNEVNQKIFLDAIKSIENSACRTIEKENSANREELNKILIETKNNYKINERISDQIRVLNEINQKTKDDFDSLIHVNTNVEKSTKDMSLKIIDFIDSNRDSVEKMSEASNKISDSAQSLDNAISNFSSEVSRTLDGVRVTLESKISDMNSFFTRTMDQASDKLVGTIDSMSLEMNKTLKNMDSGFAESMKKGSEQLRESTERSSKLLSEATREINIAVNNMSYELKNTLNEMNSGFADSMKKGSEQLQQSTEDSSKLLNSATNGIKLAVEKMSNDVNDTQKNLHETMDKIGENIKSSEEKQARILSAVTTSTDELIRCSGVSEQTIKETLVNLGEKLTTISTGNNQMKVVVKDLEESITQFSRLLEKSLNENGDAHEG